MNFHFCKLNWLGSHFFRMLDFVLFNLILKWNEIYWGKIFRFGKWSTTFSHNMLWQKKHKLNGPCHYHCKCFNEFHNNSNENSKPIEDEIENIFYEFSMIGKSCSSMDFFTYLFPKTILKDIMCMHFETIKSINIIIWKDEHGGIVIAYKKFSTLRFFKLFFCCWLSYNFLMEKHTRWRRLEDF